MQENLERFLGKLKEDFDFFDARPMSSESKPSFKKYFFPPVEEIFVRRSRTSSAPTKSDFKTKKFILFGLNLPQLEALTQMDEIMEKPNQDFFYFQRRKQAIVIGLIDEEIDSMPGGDIIFQKIGDKYKVWFENTKAKKLIEENKEFFEEVASNQSLAIRQSNNQGLTSNILTTQDWSLSMRQLLIDSELLANAVEWSRNHKIWDELAEKCLGCGVCTYVCPLCHCFSIEDSVGLDDKCSRCRKWDSCVLPEFAKISGGHSFRPTLKERYYNWFYHKFVRAYKEFGKSQCVGCEACKDNCPAGIDIQEVLKTILEEYKKKNG